MSTNVTYKMTEDHVARGKRGKCADCPVALVLTDSGLKDVSVDALYAVAKDKHGQRIRARMPAHMTSVIRRVDAGEAVEPTVFTLTWERVGARAA